MAYLNTKFSTVPYH